MMNRREFHQTVTATTTALALSGSLNPSTSAIPASSPPDPLPAGASVRLGCNRLWHQWPASNPGLNDLAFSPDGRYLATLGYQDDHVFIWSVPDGRAVRDWEPQEVDRGGDLLWTEHGLYIASNGGLSLWEPLTASLIHRFTDETMQGLARPADRRLIAATSFIGGTIEVWDTATHERIAPFFAEIDGKRKTFRDWWDFLLCVSFSRCGRWLAAGGYRHGNTGDIGGLVHFWDIALRRHLARFFTQGGPIGRLAFTPTGRLLTADWAGTVSLWDVPEGRLVRDWPRPRTGNVYRGLAVNTSGQIALQREDGVRLWHSDPSCETVLCPAQGFSNLAYSDDGRFVASGCRSGRVDLYDAATGADLSPPDRHTAHVARVEISADGTTCLACLGYPGPHHVNEIVLRDTRTGARLQATPPSDWGVLALSPVGTQVAGRLRESRLAVWDWVSGEIAVHPDLDPGAVAWHPDGQELLVVATNGEVATWHPASDQTRRQPVATPGAITALAVAADGRAVALSDRGELFVWQLDRDDPPRRLSVPVPASGPAYRTAKWPLVLAPDGLSAAVTHGDGIVYAGSLTGEALRAVYTHPPGDEGSEDGHTVVVRYTPAGRLLIAGTCTALREHHWWYTWVVTDGQSGEEVWRSPPQRMWGSIALSPDGRTLLTGYDDGTLLVWPLPPFTPP
jgi:WD40 repeat protein